jgi:hypothetical protein
MGNVTAAQFDDANNIAALALRATDAVEQAGRGLGVVYGKCRANTADSITVGVLLVVQGYVNDALKALHERESYRCPETLTGPLELPDGG